MSSVTSCPKCNTSFVVRQAQLDAHQGKVRCGHCRHVFNALERLSQPSTQNIAAYETTDLSSQAAYPMTLMEPSLHPIKFKIEETNLRQADGETPAVASTFEPSYAEPTISPVVSIPVDTSFFDKPVKKTYKRWPYAVMAGLLLITGIAQAAYYLRTPITLNYPQIKPYFLEICGVVGCDVPLPKNLVLLSLEDSDMQEHSEYQGVLQFSTKLLNHAASVQALPMLELTLTSLDDTPVLRRLFKPQEYLPTPKNELSAKEEIEIKLNITADSLPVAGYRVQLVY